MQKVVHEAGQFSGVFGDEGVDGLVAVEEARPGEVGDFVGQGGRVFAAVELVVTVPERFPFCEIAWAHVANKNLQGHGLARVSVATKLGSQVLPPSSEKDCSKRCESAVMSDQTMRTRMVRPLYVSWS